MLESQIPLELIALKQALEAQVVHGPTWHTVLVSVSSFRVPNKSFSLVTPDMRMIHSPMLPKAMVPASAPDSCVLEGEVTEVTCGKPASNLELRTRNSVYTLKLMGPLCRCQC